MNQAIAKDNKELMLALNKVHTMIRMFPTQLMTMDRLTSYEQELKDIRTQFLEFSNKVVLFAIDHAIAQNPPKTGDGKVMDGNFWQAKEQELGERMTNHQIEIRKCASDLQASRTMSEFERKDIEMKEEELKLKKRQIQLMELNQNKSEQADKAKANALAQSKYDEILLIST